MKDFFDLCVARYSLRQFADRPVEKEKIVKCLEAARLAPSASNGQPCRFVVFDDPVKKQKLCDAVFAGIYSPSQKFARAPAIVALLVTTGSLVGRLGSAVQGTSFQLIDAGIAGEHFVLQAQDLGLGTCWIGWYDSRALMRFLEFGVRRSAFGFRRTTNHERRTTNLRPVCLIAVGYPPEGTNSEHRTLNTERRTAEPGPGQAQTNAAGRISRRKKLDEIAWWNP